MFGCGREEEVGVGDAAEEPRILRTPLGRRLFVLLDISHSLDM
jgi:hypothetical protein